MHRSTEAALSICPRATQQSINVFFMAEYVLGTAWVRHKLSTDVFKANTFPPFSLPVKSDFIFWKRGNNKYIIIKSPDLRQSASLPCCYFLIVVFWIGFKRVDFILTGLLFSFNLQWKCTETEGWAEGLGDCVDAELAAPIKPEGAQVYLQVSGRWCDCCWWYGVMDVYSLQTSASLSYSSACSWGSHSVNTSRKLVSTPSIWLNGTPAVLRVCFL